MGGERELKIGKSGVRFRLQIWGKQKPLGL